MRANTKIMRPVAATLGLAVSLAALPAMAADPVYEQPPAAPAAPMEVPPVASWSGPYVGATVGYGFLGHTDTGIPAGNEIDTDGFSGSAFGGYNMQSGTFVYGVEGDIGYSGVDGTNAGVRSEAGVEGSLRARLGLAATDTVLVYGTAGGAAGNVKITDPAGSDSNTMLGWTAGVGVDAKLTEQVFGRLEYRYTDYGSETFNTGSGAQSVDATSNKIMLGVGMKF
ncbi:porin family protein [Aquibium sp. A9E412]|uniref:outer membrane protein n=1 Tax=Aquibium sp. A9E412 TaxID=2976767 RepID=UPI0025B031C0|nr:outer membrane protein [Aquibium sp. A9E412]MDN2565002.1 porin family protein [Aquibium sp. A9E412]